MTKKDYAEALTALVRGIFPEGCTTSRIRYKTALDSSTAEQIVKAFESSSKYLQKSKRH